MMIPLRSVATPGLRRPGKMHVHLIRRRAGVNLPDRILISITVNGDRRQFEAPPTCAGLVTALGLAGKRIAFERNGEIVPRSALEAHTLADGDEIEIVVAVGGG